MQLVGGGGALVVARQVQSAVLVLLGHAHGDHQVAHEHDRVRDDHDERDDGAAHGQVLGQGHALAVDEAVCSVGVGSQGAEDARAQEPHGPAQTVNGEHIQRVVDARQFLKEQARRVANEGGNASNAHAAADRHEAARRGESHQSHHHPVARTHDGGQTTHDLVHQDPRHHPCRGARVGRRKGLTRQCTRAHRTPRVEAQPAKPKERRAQEHIGDVGVIVGHHFPGADEDGSSQCGVPARHLDHSTARKVQAAPPAEGAVGVEGHVSQGAENQQVPRADEQNPAVKVHPFCQ